MAEIETLAESVLSAAMEYGDACVSGSAGVLKERHLELAAALDALAEAHQAEVARLTRENEGLAKDAARYAWLRENACNYSDGQDGPELAMRTDSPDWGAEIDAAIDAALAGASGADEGERT